MVKELKREFKSSDAEMLSTARTIYMLFSTDMAPFTTFDDTLDGAFAATFLSFIEAADTLVRDTAIIDQLAILTENVALSMENAREKYMDVKYFAQKAFQKSVATQKEFGFDDYLKARRNPVLMAQLLLELHEVCEKYKTALFAKGFSQLAIDEILTIRTDLNLRLKNQKLFQKQRPKLTEERIVLLNKCYGFMAQVMSAAQIVYRKDFAKQQQFVLLPSDKKKDDRQIDDRRIEDGLGEDRL